MSATRPTDTLNVSRALNLHVSRSLTRSQLEDRGREGGRMEGCTRHTCVRGDWRACAADRCRPGASACFQPKIIAAKLGCRTVGETTPGERSGSTSWSNTAAKLGHAEGPTDHTRGSSSVGETFPGGPADLWDFPWTLSSATLWCWLHRTPQSSIADARACRGAAAGAPSCWEVPRTSSTVSIVVARSGSNSNLV